MDKISYKYLVIGLPGSGKTTYLAALWHLISIANESESFALDSLLGNREHLNSIASIWSRCESLPRTAQAGEKVVSMILNNKGDEKAIEVVFPDLPGELFNQHWEDREWSRDYDDLVQSANGIILFITTRSTYKPIMISDVNRITKALGNEEKISSDSESTTMWEHKHATLQSILVDLLQFIKYRRCLSAPIKTSVIISAWDLVVSEGIHPTEWLSREIPLLSQFLFANNEYYNTKIFGVSAQGGALPDEKGKLIDEICPHKRLVVNEEGCINNDISKPLSWVIR